MNRGLSVIGSFGLGVGVAYFFDPEMGNRRRAVARDKFVKKVNETADGLEAAIRDLQNRVMGWVSEVESRLQQEEASDETLAERVRSKIGRVISHPGALEVRVDNKRVVLTGPILAAEVGPLLATVALVRGVADVDNRLEVHETADNVPSLQGGSPRSLQLELMQENWSATARLLMGAAGAILTLYGIKRDGIFRTMAGAAGVGILTRSIANKPVKKLFGVGGPRNVNIQKTINIAAPVEKVFEFWDNFQNFPKFMSNVREVQTKEEGKSHWVVAGPAGVPVEWDAEITERIPNKLIAWRTLPGAMVEHEGRVRFDPNPDGTSRVTVQMTYNPPAGVVGHAVASLFGADPKSEMDEDLNRMKTLIETGVRPQDAAAA